MKPSELISNKYTVPSARGFKSHPVRSLKTNDLSGGRSKNVAKRLHDGGIRKLVAHMCLRAFMDRLRYGKNCRHGCEVTQLETLEDLEFFIQKIAPWLWVWVGFGQLSGDFLLRKCRQARLPISLTNNQIQGGAA